MDAINSTHPYLHKGNYIVYMIAVFNLIMYLIYQIQIYLYILGICLVLLGLFYVFINKYNRQDIKLLISHADAIIEQKPITLIDGEGDMSLLSHKLYTLSHRYNQLIDTMQQEQIQLKSYIEDISHQLKTPITSMRLNEELLLSVMTDEKQIDKLNQIYQQTLKMNHLVNDLLTLALLDSHSIAFQFDNYSIETIIDTIEESLEHLLNQNQMTIHLHHHQEILFCDYKWFVEALENIIKNCIEKNQNGSIDIHVQQFDSLIKIIVRDHGEGFDKEELGHIFERFYRGKKSQGEGIGIGLSLAKRIIEEHHGFIQAKNDNGAVFEISIPQVLAKKKI